MQILAKAGDELDMVHLFTDKAKELLSKLKLYQKMITARRHNLGFLAEEGIETEATDITEDVIRDLALPTRTGRCQSLRAG